MAIGDHLTNEPDFLGTDQSKYAESPLAGSLDDDKIEQGDNGGLNNMLNKPARIDLEFAKRVSEFQICEKNANEIKEEIRMSMIFEDTPAKLNI